jgi:hypothetical protein
MPAVILRHPWSACAKGVLIIATGGLFALICFLILLVEAIVKLIAVPVVFLFGMRVLSLGFMKRRLSHL